MIVTITTPDGDKSEYSFDSESIILGRGQNCDIVISDDHISRKHLEIKRFEDLIFLKDLTLSNWVSYNEEKLEKGVEVQYYDFAPLILPGLYKVEISANQSAQENDSQTLTKSDIDIYHNKINAVTTATNITEFNNDIQDKKRRSRKGKKSSKDSKKKEKNELGTMAFILIAVIGFLVYQFFLKEESSLISERRPIERKKAVERKAVERKVVRRAQSNVTNFKNENELTKSEKEIVPAVKDIYSEVLASDDKCTGENVRNLCQTIFLNLTKKEGLQRIKADMYVVKNFNLRGAYLFRSSENFTNSNLSKKQLMQIVAAEGVLLPNFLKKLELDGINKISIILFNVNRTEFEVVKVFQVDVTNYRKYDIDSYSKAFADISSQQNPSYFDANLSRFIEEVK